MKFWIQDNVNKIRDELDASQVPRIMRLNVVTEEMFCCAEPSDCYLVHKSPPLFLIPSQMKLAHNSRD
jgi:hypothetical protein